MITLRGPTTNSRRTRLVPRRLQGPHGGRPDRVPRDQPALARPEARVRLEAGRAGRPTGPGSRPARSRVDPDDRALRQPEARSASGSRRTPGKQARRSTRRRDAGGTEHLPDATADLDATSEGEVSRIFQVPAEQSPADKKQPHREIPEVTEGCGIVWYRYGESNPGPVAENHVS